MAARNQLRRGSPACFLAVASNDNRACQREDICCSLTSFVPRPVNLTGLLQVLLQVSKCSPPFILRIAAETDNSGNIVRMSLAQGKILKRQWGGRASNSLQLFQSSS